MPTDPAMIQEIKRNAHLIGEWSGASVVEIDLEGEIWIENSPHLSRGWLSEDGKRQFLDWIHQRAELDRKIGKPNWQEAEQANDWRDHVPQRIRSMWLTFNRNQRAAIYEWAESLSR